MQKPDRKNNFANRPVLTSSQERFRNVPLLSHPLLATGSLQRNKIADNPTLNV